MQSPDDFIRQYFRERTADIQKELERRQPFREKFFTKDCLWDSRKGNVERSEKEIILHISHNDSKALVVTQRGEPFPKSRYNLQNSEGKWLIELVETECLSCKAIVGNGECIFCHGTGWLGDKDRLERIKLLQEKISCKIPPGRKSL